MLKFNPLLGQSLESLKKGRVLDLGSGDGTNIAYLREKGFDVKGVEKNYGETIETFIMQPGEKWDNILSFFTIHFLSPNVSKDVYKWIMENTASEGVNIMIDFTSDVTWDKTKGFYLQPNELKEMYSNWNILHYEEKLVPTRDGTQQMAAFIVAKKP